MQSDVKYQGIYRGVVVNPIDPNGLGRVTLKVPQVLGVDQVTNWAYPVVGSQVPLKTIYGAWESGVNQTTASSTATNVINLEVNDGSYGMSVTNSSRITVQYGGLYNIEFSAQFINTAATVQDAALWFRKNGVDLPGTAGYVSVPAIHSAVNGRVILSWNNLTQVNAGDYIELVWQASNTSVSLGYTAASTSPTIPYSPSIAVTVLPVGHIIPASGDNAWVMFEGGDPNFPLWLGTF